MPDLVALDLEARVRARATTTTTATTSAAQAAGSNLFDYDAATEELNPIPLSQIFDAYTAFGDRTNTRCPGGATQPNLGWPAPEDHPFLADGELAGDCEPTDVPPGP